MSRGVRKVCGGNHRIALASMGSEVARYRATPALLAATVAAGIGLAIPVVTLHGRLSLPPLRGGDLGLLWRAGVRPPAATQQAAVEALDGLLLWTALVTLAIAAVTVLVLCLAREAERAGEVSVRRAVGAGRRLLLGSALLEGGIIALAGLAAGGILGAIVAPSMARWPGALGPGELAPGVMAVAGLVAIVLAGVSFPVLFPRRRVGEAEPHRPAPLMPSAIQIGASLMALTAGALLARHAEGSLAALSRAPADGAVYAIAMPDTAPAERAHRYAALLRSLPPGTHGLASLTSPGALLGLGPVGTVTTDCGRCSEGGLPLPWRVKPATHHLVSADTFQMLGMKVVEGRGLTDRDAWEAPRVAVINRSLAAREFQDGQAIGRGIRVVDDADRWSTVVGVVDDQPPGAGIGGAIQPRYTVYLSVLQHPPAAADLLLGPRAGPGRSVLSVARAALGAGALDPAAVPVSDVVGGQAAPLRWFAAQIGLQGWAMLAMAMLGSLAVTRLWVTSLLGELGLRRAMGARRRQTAAYVLRRAAAVGGAGIAGGVWFGGAVWSMVADQVPGLEPWDAGIVARFGLVLLAGAVLGALPPALRASRAAPASLLGAS